MKGIDACSHEEFQYAIQQPAGRVGNPMDIANMVLFLCSGKAGFITGENICIDGGMTRQMIYHGDSGWTLNNKIENNTASTTAIRAGANEMSLLHRGLRMNT